MGIRLVGDGLLRQGSLRSRTSALRVVAYRCSASQHMLPPILFFVVLVLVIALLAYHQAVRRIVHPPKL